MGFRAGSGSSAVLSRATQDGVAVTPQALEYRTLAGPAAYAAGGFSEDLSDLFSAIRYAQVTIETRGNLPTGSFLEITRDAPASGHITIVARRGRYDRATSGGDTAGAKDQPAGVTVAGAQGQQVNAGGGHGHGPDATGVAGNHTHDTNPMVVPVRAAAAVDAVGGAGNAANQDDTSDHDHTVVAVADHSHSIAQAAGHQHVMNILYNHEHLTPALAQTETDLAAVEVANGTNLAGLSLRLMVIGDPA